MSQSQDELEREARLVVARVPTDETIVPLRIVRALLDALDEARRQLDHSQMLTRTATTLAEVNRQIGEKLRDERDEARRERDALRLQVGHWDETYPGPCGSTSCSATGPHSHQCGVANAVKP